MSNEISGPATPMKPDDSPPASEAVCCDAWLGISAGDRWGRYALSEIEIGDRARWNGADGTLFMDGPFLMWRRLGGGAPAVMTIFPTPDGWVTNLRDVRREISNR